MRCTTLKACTPDRVDRLLDYYAGLAEDAGKPCRSSRGPVDYYLDPDEPAGRWWGSRPSRARRPRRRRRRRAAGVARVPSPGDRRPPGAGVRGEIGAGVRRDVLGPEVGVGAVGAHPGSVGAGRGPRRPRRRGRRHPRLVRGARGGHPARHRRRRPGRHPRDHRRRCSVSTRRARSIRSCTPTPSSPPRSRTRPGSGCRSTPGS